jgi:predicted short-subunit dehydrogenase-like oxidoreductase (DUF2520 family)
MDIVIIGSGNVAAVMGRRFKSAGHNVLQIFSRNAPEASALAYELNTESTNYKSMVNKNAELYLIAVSDNGIPDVVDDLRLPGKVVAHTAASVPKDILKTVSDHYGVFYPLQSLRKDNTDFPEIPIYFDASDDKTKKILERLANSIDSPAVGSTNNDLLVKLHLAAVIAGNFTNHLYALAEAYCKKEGIDFRQLLPLIEETAKRIEKISPKDAQTGPALRHDTETIQKHLELLSSYPLLKNVYLMMTESIQHFK